MERAKYIKTFYDNGKYTNYYLRKVQVYEYKGYEYYIYPDATFLAGNELSDQHKDAQYKIDKLLEFKNRESENTKTCEECLDDFFKFCDGEIEREDYLK